MKKIVLIMFCLLSVQLLASDLHHEVSDPPSNAQTPRFELGGILGFPTGISAKYWFNRRVSVDLAAAWAFEDGGSFEVHSDLLYNLFFISTNYGLLPVYFGVGGAVYFTDDPFAGVRIPIGVSYLLDEAPLSVFIEVVPIIGIAPTSEFRFGGGIGARMTFPLRRR
jgi:hypothetical protein